jgi:hypothetical protein
LCVIDEVTKVEIFEALKPEPDGLSARHLKCKREELVDAAIYARHITADVLHGEGAERTMLGRRPLLADRAPLR